MIIVQSTKYKVQSSRGFTLIELLIVMAILGVLATVGLQSFQFSQLKSRDAKRKSDLEQVQRALEMYYNDYGFYPVSADGKIKLTASLDWGAEFVDAKDTVYMKELPQDPKGGTEYCYSSIGTAYQIYAKLENSQDPKLGGPYTCNVIATYNYGVASSNTAP